MTTVRATPARIATRADLDALPEHVKGEIIGGVLYTMTRPPARHGVIQARLGGKLDSPYGLGDGGPGGWWIVVEPGIELPGATEVAPDLAGWRKERLPELPEDGPIRLAPDWVCEILSPTTRAYDLRVKKPFYANAGVPWLWWVDLDARSLLVHKLVDGQWLEVGNHGDDEQVRAAPFDAIEIRLSDWWPPTAPPVTPEPVPAKKKAKPRKRG